MEARMTNPAMVLGAMEPFQALFKAVAEAATRLADRPDRMPDQLWDAAAAHYDEKGMAAIVLMIAVTNLFNRLNATTRQVAGAWG